MENIYVVDYNKRGIASQESTNVLQEEDDKSISLGTPMYLQEEVNDEQPEKEE